MIRHLYLSTGHNYFGHGGGEAPDDFPILEQEEIECVAGHGLRGDRFFDYRRDYKGQITFFAWEVHDLVLQRFGIAKPPSCYRRNVITEGLDLSALVGAEFELQGVCFVGTQESRPCEWMNAAVAPGASSFLKGRGGLRARILTDGILRKTGAAASV